MRQREIHLVKLDPVVNNEQSGIRPVVVISGDAMNEHYKFAIICPLSSVIKGYAGCLIIPSSMENGLNCDSEVLTFQIRTISAVRSIKKLGTISKEQLSEIITGLSKTLRY